jgi:hypothetical protein
MTVAFWGLAGCLDKRLTDYLTVVNARMPAPNPSFDPANVQPFQGRQGGRRMKADP